MTGGRPFPKGQSGNPATQWRKGQSGNPAGSSRARLEFERVFYAALLGEGSAEEAAKLLWECARKKEPWAVQTLLQRLAPQTQTVRLTHEVADNGGYDFSRLSESELEQIERILERAGGPVAQLEGGEGPAPAA